MARKLQAKRSIIPKGLYKSSFYRAWQNMKTRCTNVNIKDYARYGGRGIKYCEEWELFTNFYNDMFESFESELTLDRIDVNQGYSKENCRWATPTEQANNRRSSKYITLGSETQTLENWIKTSGIKSSTVRQRIYGYGWTPERALVTPSRVRRIVS